MQCPYGHVARRNHTVSNAFNFRQTGSSNACENEKLRLAPPELLFLQGAAGRFEIRARAGAATLYCNGVMIVAALALALFEMPTLLEFVEEIVAPALFTLLPIT